MNEIPSRIFDKILTDIIFFVFPPSATVKELFDIYGEISDANTLYDYLSEWVPSGDYRTIVALYKNKDEGYYLIRTITLSSEESFLCSDGIRGIGYSDVNWDDELSLKVFVRSR